MVEVCHLIYGFDRGPVWAAYDIAASHLQQLVPVGMQREPEVCTAFTNSRQISLQTRSVDAQDERVVCIQQLCILKSLHFTSTQVCFKMYIVEHCCHKNN